MGEGTYRFFCKIKTGDEFSLKKITSTTESFFGEIDEDCEPLEVKNENGFTVLSIHDYYDDVGSFPSLLKTLSRFCSSKPFIEYYQEEDEQPSYAVYFGNNFQFYNNFDDAINAAERDSEADENHEHNNFRTSLITLSLTADERIFKELIEIFNTITTSPQIDNDELFKLMQPVMLSDYESDGFSTDLTKHEWAGQPSPLLQSLKYFIAKHGKIELGIDVFDHSFNIPKPSDDEDKEYYFSDKVCDCVERFVEELLCIEDIDTVSCKLRSNLLDDDEEVFSIGGEDGVYITHCQPLTFDQLSPLIRHSSQLDERPAESVFKISESTLMTGELDVKLFFFEDSETEEDIYTIVGSSWSPQRYAQSWLKSLEYLKSQDRTTFNFYGIDAKKLNEIDREDLMIECFSVWKVADNRYQIQESEIMGEDLDDEFDQDALYDYMAPWPDRSEEPYFVTGDDLTLLQEYLEGLLEQ